ncbi:MAG: twin-arginine translocase subunit TatB [Litoreibacter sp.]|nr:twin-arginine translocase subunit TatB [Litoreibacter sp.]
MFDIGWTELLVIGLVALIVVGPKDLPGMFRTLGQFTAKAKRMAREFQRSMEDAADEAGVKDMTNTLRTATNPKDMGLDAVKKATSFDKWDEDSETGKLSKERAEAAKKIHAATAKAAEARKAREAKSAPAEDAPAAKPAAKKPAARKPAAKKPAAKKVAKAPAAKSAAKKPAAKSKSSKDDA